LQQKLNDTDDDDDNDDDDDVIFAGCLLLLQPVLWLSPTRGAISEDLSLQSTPGEKVSCCVQIYSFAAFVVSVIGRCDSILHLRNFCQSCL